MWNPETPLSSHDASHFAISAIIRATVRICNRPGARKIKTVASDYSELMEGFYTVDEFYFIAQIGGVQTEMQRLL